MIYRVFARDELAKPISFTDEIEAADESGARQSALDLVPDGAVEVTIVPADVVHWVVRPREESEAR